MPTREAIEGKLKKELVALIAHYRAMNADELVRPCTESEAEDGEMWSPKDHLAHLVMIERSFAAMVRRGIAGDERPVGLGGGGRDQVYARVHNTNEQYVREHKDDDLETLIADLQAARADTLQLLSELTDEQLATPLKGAPWADGTIGGVLITNGYHQVQHTNWVNEGLSRALDR